MLESAIEFKDVFVRLGLEDTNYTTIPSDDDWDKATMICGFLKKFYDATVNFSGTKYPTVHLFLSEVVKINMKLEEKLNSEIDWCRDMARSMKAKFDKYWENYSPIYELAVYLDPRYKQTYLKYAFKKLFNENETDLMRPHFSRARLIFETVFREYSEKYSKHEVVKGSDSSVISSTNIEEDDYWRFVEEEEQLPLTEDKTELVQYCEEKVKPTPDFDILLWWKVHSNKYPILSKIAKDILVVPASTVPSESAFSTSGRVLDQFRSSLKPTTVEALVCSQDWIRSEKNNDNLDISKLDILNSNVDD